MYRPVQGLTSSGGGSQSVESLLKTVGPRMPLWHDNTSFVGMRINSSSGYGKVYDFRGTTSYVTTTGAKAHVTTLQVVNDDHAYIIDGRFNLGGYTPTGRVFIGLHTDAGFSLPATGAITDNHVGLLFDSSLTPELSAYNGTGYSESLGYAVDADVLYYMQLLRVGSSYKVKLYDENMTLVASESNILGHPTTDDLYFTIATRGNSGTAQCRFVAFGLTLLPDNYSMDA